MCLFIDTYPVRSHIKIVTPAAFIENIGKNLRYGFINVNLRDACVQFRHGINRNIEVRAKPNNRFLCVHVVKLIGFFAFIEIPAEIGHRILILKFISVIDRNYNTAEYLNVGAEVYDIANKNANEVLSQDEYINEYTKLTKKYEKKAKQREKLISEKEDKFRRANEIKLYVQKMIETKNSVTEWDDTLWVIFLDSAIVNTDGTIEFCFKDGAKIPV